MTTVRFSKVVEKSGKPEIYLLLSAKDSVFAKALKEKRVLSLMGQQIGKADYGEVGYDAKTRAQLLVFPKSLKTFEGKHIVGIKYEEFSENAAQIKPAKTKATQSKIVAAKKALSSQRKSEAEKENPKAGAGKKKGRESRKSHSDKIIPFSNKKNARNQGDEDDSLADLRRIVKQALRLLEKGNEIAAYNVLKNAMGEEE